MGFLDAVFDPPRKGQSAVDNSERNVEARLDYLRYPITQSGDILPATVSDLPRQVIWRVSNYSYGLCYRVDDSNNYPYTVAQKKAALASKEYYRQDTLSLGTVMYLLNRRKPHLFEAFFRPDSAAVVVPYTTVEVLGDTIGLPGPIREVAGLSDNAAADHFYRAVNACLTSSDKWHGDRYPYREPGPAYNIGVFDPEPEYTMLYQLDVDITINGVPADGYNLTHTERSKIIASIRDGIAHGSFQSDGKEKAECIPTNIFDIYEARLSESRNFTRWYRHRYTSQGMIQSASQFRGRR